VSENLRKRRIAELENAIRTHRDARGDDRCWLDDQTLYAVLPEGAKSNTALPPEKTFLANCKRFWTSRQDPNHAYISEQERVLKLIASRPCEEIGSGLRCDERMGPGTGWNADEEWCPPCLARTARKEEA
jgi:hypothetical protein